MPPMGPRGPKGMKGGPKSKDPVKTLKRLLAFIMKRYKFRYIIVLICIAISSIGIGYDFQNIIVTLFVSLDHTVDRFFEFFA